MVLLLQFAVRKVRFRGIVGMFWAGLKHRMVTVTDRGQDHSRALSRDAHWQGRYLRASWQ